MTKAKILRSLFATKELICLVGAHNGLTARLVEKSGFDGIWASSLEVSASHAVPDANILTMTDYLNAAIDMNDAVNIPVICDVDQGYGNSNNVIYMVKKFEAAGIAGIIMEDKLFPKQNSLLSDGRQELASISEFVGKIMAAKNAQKSNDFMLIARIEALIAGWGQEEALKRGKAYVEAGADGIMIHSKAKEPAEIIEFVNKWDLDIPIVIVPTTYASFTEENIREYTKIKMVIYANHVIRSAVTAIKDTLKEIKEKGGVYTVNNKLIPVSELFELQGTQEMKANEKRFLKTGVSDIKAIIPAAGIPPDDKLRETVLADTPVCMLDINGKSILQRTVEKLRSAGVSEICVVTGYSEDKINIEDIVKVRNKEYSNTGIIHSMMCAKEFLEGRILVVYSDIIFDSYILDQLLKKKSEIAIVIDASYKTSRYYEKRSHDLVVARKKPIIAERAFTMDTDNEVLSIGPGVTNEQADYEFIGMALFSKKAIIKIKQKYNNDLDKYKNKDLVEILQEMIEEGFYIDCVEVNKGWTEVHTFEDYKKVNAVIAARG